MFFLEDCYILGETDKGECHGKRAGRTTETTEAHRERYGIYQLVSGQGISAPAVAGAAPGGYQCKGRGPEDHYAGKYYGWRDF